MRRRQDQPTTLSATDQVGVDALRPWMEEVARRCRRVGDSYLRAAEALERPRTASAEQQRSARQVLRFLAGRAAAPEGTMGGAQ